MSTLGNNLLAEYYAQQNFGPRSNEVWYWADEQVTLYSQTNVASHTFADGKGVITYTSDLAKMPNTLRATAITDVKMPSGVTGIGSNVFRGCSSLALTSLPNGITSIGGSAFYGCSTLALTSLPSGMTSIGQSAFYGCTNLALTSLPSGVTSIGVNTFHNCTNLVTITFSGTPTNISSSAFSGCSNLTTIRVPWSSTDAINADAPWGATNAVLTYNYTE